MSKLEKLIEELCPNGVEYKPLGELGSFYGGITGKSKEDFKDGNAKFITYKNVYSNPSLNLDVEDKVRIVPDEKQRTLQYGDVIFTGSSETPDECGISSVLTQRTDEKLYLNSFCFVFRFNDLSCILPDFAKHLFRSRNLRYQIGRTASGVTRFNVSKDKMKKVIIPIPPLEVQNEIVRILDNFTELNEKLQAELTARKKQYEYYRNVILTLNSRVKIVELGEICKFVRGPFGGALKKEIFQANGYAVYEQQHAIYKNLDFRYYIDENKFDELKRFSVQSGDMIVSCSGTIGKTFIIPDNAPNGVINQALLKLTPTKLVDVAYLQFFFENTIAKLLNGAARGGAIKNVPSVAELKSIKIPLPSLEVQKRLVNILNNFDALCNDISAGLPSEIEARQKQYEYYRDKLLSFKSLSLNE